MSGEANLAAQVVDSIRREVLARIPPGIEELTPEKIEMIRDKLHALRYFSAAQDLDEGVSEGLAAALNVTQGLWELLEQNSSTFDYLRQMENIRRLDLGANLAEQGEAIMAGETQFGEFLASSIASLLGWISDSIWVELARHDQHGVSKAHAVRLRDELWNFLAQLNAGKAGVSLADALILQERTSGFFKLLADESVPAGGRVLLLGGMYVLMLVLHIDRVIGLLAPEKPRTLKKI